MKHMTRRAEIVVRRAITQLHASWLIWRISSVLNKRRKARASAADTNLRRGEAALRRHQLKNSGARQGASVGNQFNGSHGATSQRPLPPSRRGAGASTKNGGDHGQH